MPFSAISHDPNADFKATLRAALRPDEHGIAVKLIDENAHDVHFNAAKRGKGLRKFLRYPTSYLDSESARTLAQDPGFGDLLLALKGVDAAQMREAARRAAGKAVVNMGDEARSVAGLAHELGHHQFGKSRAGRIIQGKLYGIGGFSPLVGALSGAAAFNSDHEAAPWLAAGATAATAAPMLISEAAASYNGMKMLRRHGLHSAGQRAVLRELLGAGGTYLARAGTAAAAVGVPLWMRKQRLEEQAARGAKTASQLFDVREDNESPVARRVLQHGAIGAGVGALTGLGLTALAPRLLGDPVRTGLMLTTGLGLTGVSTGISTGLQHGSYEYGRINQNRPASQRNENPLLEAAMPGFALGSMRDAGLGAYYAHRGAEDAKRYSEDT